MIPFYVFLACLCFTYALYMLATRKSDARRARLNQRLEEAIRASADSDDVEVRLAREELLSEIPWLNRAMLNVQVAGRLKRVIDQADVQITVVRLTLFSLTAGVFAFFAASMLSTFRQASQSGHIRPPCDTGRMREPAPFQKVEQSDITSSRALQSRDGITKAHSGPRT